MSKKLIIYLSVMILLSGGIVAFGFKEPEMVHDILISVDVFGVTATGKMEKARVRRINALGLPVERREALISRTVFIEATTEMVYLALGSPRQPKIPDVDSIKGLPGMQRWVYFFPEDRRPTVLEFKDGVLEKAYKGSAADMQAYTGAEQGVTPANTATTTQP